MFTSLRGSLMTRFASFLTTLFVAATIVGTFCPTTTRAQFPVTLTVSARSGDVFTTPITRTDARYRITVRGTYSQWPQFVNCGGVDAVWVYDVPQEEIDAFRWPAKTMLGRPFVDIPHWVGDSTVYAFPPQMTGMNPLFAISFRKNLGFRVNGEPLPPLTMDTILHRYQQERAGTGEAFRFQILDSTYNVALGRVIPRYEDNCGELIVTVEEILERDVNICSVELVEVKGQQVGVRVDAAVFERDEEVVDGRRNVLGSKDQLGIVVDGRFLCPDSLVCDSVRTRPLSVGLVVDVSGSMMVGTTYDGRSVTRLAAVKQTLHKFMATLRPGDSLFLLTFSSYFVLSHDWTTDTARLGQTIDALTAGGSTALYAAMIHGLEKMSNHQRDGRVLIVLTDGFNNQAPLSETPVVAAIQSANIPLYIVALGLATTPSEQQGLKVLQRLISAAPRGRLYDARTGDELQHAYTEMANTMETESCCRLYFPLPPCDSEDNSRRLRLVYVDGDKILTKDVDLPCERTTTSVYVPEERAERTNILTARPTPSDDKATIHYPVVVPSTVTATIVTAEGRIQSHVNLGLQNEGYHEYTVSTTSWSPGLYLCRIWNGQSTVTYSIIVAH